MITRFQGSDGERHLLTALQNCSIVEHNEALAKRLAGIGELVAFKRGDALIVQHSADNEVYFLLAGEVEILVNNRRVATRNPGETVGEMAILDPSRPRSATVNALTPTAALKVSEPKFHELANEFPQLWRAIAKVVSARLDQRAALLNTPNQLPVLFIGCATESLEIAQHIQLGLKHFDVEVTIWTDGVFGPSRIPVEDLLSKVRVSDFAAFVFSPDDKVTSKREEYNAPRDNVVFELGLFMGQLDRKRTFIVREQNSDVKIPTDLLGINPLTYYANKSGDLSAALGPVCTEIKKAIKDLGAR
jgi:CRP/FNR family transcriptional regulator, cyclic AMP receptor protein